MAQKSDREDALSNAVAGLHGASAAGTVVAGISSTHVDLVYFIDSDRLTALVAAARGERGSLFPEGEPADLAGTVIERMRGGRGGFIITEWPTGADSFIELLGEPDRAQVGGAMPHAAWALSEIGASTVMALNDRSEAQLGVLDPRIGVVTDGSLSAVSDCRQVSGSGTPPHIVLEFAAGTEACGICVPRSTRLVLGFGRFGIETDDGFVDWAIEAQTPAVLVSGLTFADLDAPDFAWIEAATRRLRAAGIHIYHEFTEFPSEWHFAQALQSVQADSLGCSLSELPGTGDAVERAVELGERTGVERVVVHADDWSMSVHRTPHHDIEVEALWAGNVLAAARAVGGRPVAEIGIPANAEFSTDIPPSGPLGGGWHVSAVASPYIADPGATIGLGDTFTGGFLLTLTTAQHEHTARHGGGARSS